jgi:hypothetical protein
MKMALTAGLLALVLAPAFGQTFQGMKLFPPLAPLPTFTPASQLKTQALAQQDLDKNDALLASLQQMYSDTASRARNLSGQMSRLNAMQSAVADIRKMEKSDPSMALGGLLNKFEGLLNGYPTGSLDATSNSINTMRLQVGYFLGHLQDRENTLRSQMEAVKAQIGADQGALLAIAHGLPTSALTAKPAPAPAPLPAAAVVPPAVKAAATLIDNAIKAGLARIQSATPLFGKSKPNPNIDTLNDMKPADEQQISDLGAQYTASINAATTPAAQAAAIAGFKAAIGALVTKQESAVNSAINNGIQAAQHP